MSAYNPNPRKKAPKSAVRSKRKEAANVTTSRVLESAVLKTAVPIKGDARIAITNPGPAIANSSLRLVAAMPLALVGSLLPMWEEMNRVAAMGRANCVSVVKIELAAARSDISPTWERLRIRTSRT